MLDMERAQICVARCKLPEIIFNRATILNQETAGTFIDKCISNVGLKDFKAYDANDPKMTKEQANRMLYCIRAGKEISSAIDTDLKDEYLAKYESFLPK